MTVTEVLQRFGELPFTVELEIGALEMPIRELLELREGTVIRTEHPCGAPFPMRAGEVVLAEAEVVMVDDSVSVRIKTMAPDRKQDSVDNGSN